jgi:iron(III) transport system permease protein
VNERYFPITKAIYYLTNRIEDGPFIASALGVWAMGFLAVGLALAGSILKGRMGALFRTH